MAKGIIEAGVCGFTDPDNRRTYPWGKEDKKLIEYHRDLIKIHKDHEALMIGSIKFLGGKENCLYYGRFTEEEMIVVALNNGEETANLEIPVWEIGVPNGVWMKQLILSDEKDYSKDTASYLVQHGKVYVNMPVKSAIILKYEADKALKTVTH